MKTVIVISTIILPLIMYFLHRKSDVLRKLFHLAAFILAIVFANSVALTIYETWIHDAVYTTSIHGILLNPYFLIPGAYLGIFFIYKLFSFIFDDS